MAHNPEHWQTQNPKWLKARQTKWQKHILPMLKELADRSSLLRKDELKQYKQYYISGQRLPYTESSRRAKYRKHFIGKPIEIPLVLQILCYPIEDAEVFNTLVEDYFTELNDAHSRYNEFYLYQDYNAQVKVSLRHLTEEELTKTQYCDQLIVCRNFEESKGPHLEKFLDRKIEVLNKLFDTTNWTTASQLFPFRPYRYSFELYRYLLQEIPFDELAEDSLMYIYGYMNRLNHEKLKNQPGKDYVAKANQMAIAMFEKGITPQIDALWAQCKIEPLDWESR